MPICCGMTLMLPLRYLSKHPSLATAALLESSRIP